jgi:integrase
MLKKHLLPRFGDTERSEITRQEVLTSHAARIRTEVHRSHSRCTERCSPDRGEVGAPSRQSCAGRRLAKAQDGQSKVGTDPQQAAALLDALPPLARTMVGLAILSGCDVANCSRCAGATLTSTRGCSQCERPSTTGRSPRRRRKQDCGESRYQTQRCDTSNEWKQRAGATGPDKLVFVTRTGRAISPNNVLRPAIFPGCDALKLPRATWLTFRRSYSSWSRDKGVPGKVVAQLVGHANVHTTLNVYMQVLDGSLRAAVDKVGGEVFTIIH